MKRGHDGGDGPQTDGGTPKGHSPAGSSWRPARVGTRTCRGDGKGRRQASAGLGPQQPRADRPLQVRPGVRGERPRVPGWSSGVARGSRPLRALPHRPSSEISRRPLNPPTRSVSRRRRRSDEGAPTASGGADAAPEALPAAEPLQVGTFTAGAGAALRALRASLPAPWPGRGRPCRAGAGRTGRRSRPRTVAHDVVRSWRLTGPGNVSSVVQRPVHGAAALLAGKLASSQGAGAARVQVEEP